MPRTTCFSLGFLVVLLLCPLPAGRAEDKKPGTVRILLLGDSTVIGSACRRAGYHVIGDEAARFLAPLLRERLKSAPKP